ncbi:MAG: ATP-binding protein [Oscillospiraceae bacterium]|nr:ATP-binding protein [Oscillospiraceae bacterium]
MLLAWGESRMTIKCLQIKGLHGIYDYNIDFNDDLTFIYGENGCGKTTILDIVSSIVTGKIYNLFGYDFDQIILSYKKSKRSKLDHIKIESVGEAYELSHSSLNLSETIKIEDTSYSNETYSSRYEEEYAFDRRFMSRYEFPRFLRESFNYIYLPLSRNSQDGIDINESISYRRRRAALYGEKDFTNKNYLNNSLRYIEDIIRNRCMQISSAENMVSTRFRSNILTSSLKVNSDYDFSRLWASLRHEITLPIIEKNRMEYIRTLKSIGEWNEDTDKQVKTFFEKYRDAFVKASDDGFDGVPIDLFLMNTEFNRIQQIAAQAQEIEKEKEKIRAPITTFLKTVNSFFDVGEDKKQIFINNVGRITLEATSPQRKVSLYNLSSGEKQIVIIFACLIFGLSAGESGIYIIDEPEASLHLAWQKNFVESIRRVNGSIQLIFATHAPEIIGRYSSKAVKLQKNISLAYKEKDDLFDE